MNQILRCDGRTIGNRERISETMGERERKEKSVWRESEECVEGKRRVCQGKDRSVSREREWGRKRRMRES